MKNKLKKGAMSSWRIIIFIILFPIIVAISAKYGISQLPPHSSNNVSISSNNVSFLGLAYVGAIIASIISIAVIFIPIELNKAKHKNYSAKNKRIITKKKKYNNRNKR